MINTLVHEYHLSLCKNFLKLTEEKAINVIWTFLIYV